MLQFDLLSFEAIGNLARKAVIVVAGTIVKEYSAIKYLSTCSVKKVYFDLKISDTKSAILEAQDDVVVYLFYMDLADVKVGLWLCDLLLGILQHWKGVLFHSMTLRNKKLLYECKHVLKQGLLSCEFLNDVVDESDSDFDEPVIERLLQTAEAIGKVYPNEGWLHLTGLIHDLGKFLLHPSFGGLSQWAVVACR
ncbi:Inositol oxygenase [Corchorus olitorius]|uniref:Inositol oxygenase n=1 Tax=Corchorus olitorius TaxID=93759 RepID=A0A1R3HAL3_9ROSI|nr:Inositol oxygenase [Corchorus olitorius]